MLAMGVLELKKYADHYQKLQRIFARTLSLVDEFHPDCLAIEAPFFGKNVQSMLKLGRAQGAAIAAALYRDLPVSEYAPLKIKMAITGNGRAAKEQVADMLRRYLRISQEDMLPQLDATDGLAAAYCHFLQSGKPSIDSEYKSWKDYINQNGTKVRK
jgi:crossover junction endodeoxyribonuclease RuvC